MSYKDVVGNTIAGTRIAQTAGTTRTARCSTDQLDQLVQSVNALKDVVSEAKGSISKQVSAVGQKVDGVFVQVKQSKVEVIETVREQNKKTRLLMRTKALETGMIKWFLKSKMVEMYGPAHVEKLLNKEPSQEDMADVSQHFQEAIDAMHPAG